MTSPKGKLQWLLLAVAFLGILLFQALPGPRHLDDAYITYRYARNISEGAGFVYNPGEHVMGTSTPLYTLLLALLAWILGSNQIPSISFGISLIADALNFWLFFQLARYFLKSDWIAYAAALVFLLQPLRLNVAVGGMETSLFILFLLAMYVQYFVKHNLYFTATLAALAFLTRIDAVLAIAPLFAYAAWKDHQRIIKPAVLAVLLMLPWLLWATLYFGSPIPFSLTAKQAAYQFSDPRSTLVFLLNFLGTGTVGPYEQIAIMLPGLVTFLFLAFFGLKHIIKNKPETLVIVLYPFLYYLTMGILHVQVFFIWYYLPLMPGILILLFNALIYISKAMTPRILPFLYAGFSASMILIPLALLNFLPGWGILRSAETKYQQVCGQIKGEIRPGEVVFAPDIGVLGWCLDRAKIFDPIGLTSPESLAYMKYRKPDELISPALLSAVKPDLLISSKQLVRNIITDPQFQAEYSAVPIQADPGTGADPIVVVYSRN